MLTRARIFTRESSQYLISIFLILSSICLGLVGAFLGARRPLAFSTGMLILGSVSGIMTLVAFVVTVGLTSYLHRIEPLPDTPPDLPVRRHGLRFLTWFIGHNLFWMALAALSVALLLSVFGPATWVMVYSVGALACASYAFIGLLFATGPKMLGLCWRSPIPNGLLNILSRAEATVILRDRFEYAVAEDFVHSRRMENFDPGQSETRQIRLLQSGPVLQRIADILDLAPIGGAKRGVMLWESSFSSAFKKEVINRFLVFLALSIIAVLFALLTAIFWPITSPAGGSPPVAATEKTPVPYPTSKIELSEDETIKNELAPNPTTESEPSFAAPAAKTPAPGEGTQPAHTADATTDTPPASNGTPERSETKSASPSGEATVGHTAESGTPKTETPGEATGKSSTPGGTSEGSGGAGGIVQATSSGTPEGEEKTPGQPGGEAGGKEGWGSSLPDPSAIPYRVTLPAPEPGEIIELTLVPDQISGSNTPEPTGTTTPTVGPTENIGGTSVPHSTPIPVATVMPMQLLPTWIRIIFGYR